MYTKWLIDPLHSFVRFDAHYLLLTKLYGWCTEFDGIFRTKEHFAIQSINFNIYTHSLQTGNKGRDMQLKSGSFLDCSNFPVISYASETIQASGDAISAIGLMRIKDIERKTTLTLDHKGFASDQYGNTKAGIVANIRINASAFNLKFDDFCRHDIHCVSDEINLQLELQLLKFST